jgi:C4-dicarboxylate transporter, DctM subunit
MGSGLPLISAAQTVFESLDSFSLMAVPFYILAGSIMQAGGISQRLVNLANALIGWLKGGLGGAAILTSMLFATISGSSSATTAAVGSTTIPAMVKKGYPRPYAAALVAASGELGVIIPPSLPIIIYGLVMNQSIATLFIAGILPGIMIGGSLIVTSIVTAYVRGFDDVTSLTPREWIVGVLKATWEAGLALMCPSSSSAASIPEPSPQPKPPSWRSPTGSSSASSSIANCAGAISARSS